MAENNKDGPLLSPAILEFVKISVKETSDGQKKVICYKVTTS